MTTNPPEQTPDQGPAVPPPPAPGYAAPAAPLPPLSDAEQRQWAMFAHLGGILLWFVAPLIIWLMYKGRGRFVEEQAKEALNFQITVAGAQIVVGILGMILTVATLGLGSILWGLLFWVIYIGMVVFCIIAGMAANKGEAYRYPVNVRLIK